MSDPGGGAGGGEERIRAERIQKLEALREAGVEPYAYRFDRTHTLRQALAAHARDGPEDGEGPQVRVAGRIVALRRMGRASFLHLADRDGRLQAYLRRDDLGEERYGMLRHLDLGDWLGIAGPLFRTRTGETTVRAEEVTVLTKSLRPLPMGKEGVDPDTGERRVFSGLTDREARYRQRYLDLAVNPEVREVFEVRARVVRALRSFLDERGFLEVETPILQPVYGGAAARPFTTYHHALDTTLYLRIADELYLKRLIVGGMERVYEIGKDFRNEGLSRFHNPEFTMLEFYAAFLDYEAVMELTQEMLAAVTREAVGSTSITIGEREVDLGRTFRRLSLYDALEEHAGIRIPDLDEGALRKAAREAGSHGVEEMGRGKLIDELFGLLVEPHLIEPTFVVDHPRETSPLAKPKRGEPRLVERFELIVGGKEIINAYSELNDPLDQRARFEEQERLRRAGDEEATGMDEDFVRALEHGMPPTGGLGMGVDRFVMILTGQPSIRDVILFPTLRPERPG